MPEAASGGTLDALPGESGRGPGHGTPGLGSVNLSDDWIRGKLLGILLIGGSADTMKSDETQQLKGGVEELRDLIGDNEGKTIKLPWI